MIRRIGGSRSPVKLRHAIFPLWFVAAAGALAHQPVMDMAPRWAGGYGVQLFQVHNIADDLRHGQTTLPNPHRLGSRVDTTWLEGVYTFRREFRITAKVPYVDKSRQWLQDGEVIHQTGQGLGDIIIGAPIKKYVNKRGYTYNLSLTPSLRLPTGSTGDDWAVGDGSWDAGLSLSYSFETPKWYHLYDLYYWKNGSGRNFDQGDELAFDANIGWHAWHDGDNGRGLFLMLDIAARHIEPGKNQMVDPAGDTIAVGPVAMYYHEDWMLKFEYRQTVYDKAKSMRFGDHRRFAVGFGLAF
jgi:hypothetical protein